MSLSIDTTTVAPVFSNATNTNVSGSFTAPANSRLIVLVTTNAPTSVDSATQSCAGGSLTWTRRALISKGNGGLGGGSSAEIWEAWNASSQTMTVTITPNASANFSSWEVRTQTCICTGDEGSTFSGATNTTSSASGAPSASVTTAANSMLLSPIADWATKGAGTAGTNTTIFLDQTDLNYSSHMLISTSAVSAGSNSLSLTAPATQNYNMAIIEIKAPVSSIPLPWLKF